MKLKLPKTIFLLLLSAQLLANRYTWTPMSSMDFLNGTNWTPSRTSPLASDTLIFDGSNLFSGSVSTAYIYSFVPPAQQYLFGGYYEVKNNMRMRFTAGNTAAQGMTWKIGEININAGSRLFIGGTYYTHTHMSRGRIDGLVDYAAGCGGYLKFPGVDVYGKINIHDNSALLHDGAAGDPNTTNLVRFQPGSELVLIDQGAGFWLLPVQQYLPGSTIRITGNSIFGITVPPGNLPVLPNVIEETTNPNIESFVFNNYNQNQPLTIAGNLAITAQAPPKLTLNVSPSEVVIQGNLTSTRGFVVNAAGGGVVSVEGNFSFSGTCVLSEWQCNTLKVKGHINDGLPLSRNRPVITETSSSNSGACCLLWLNGNVQQNVGYIDIQQQVAVRLDNPAGFNFIYSQNIPYQLEMVNGMVYNPGRNVVTFTNPNATVTGYNATKFFTGKVKTTGISAFFYPVGKGNMYRPIKTENATGDFEVEYIRADPSAAYPQPISTSAPFVTPISAISTLEYWQVNATGTSPSAKVFMNYDASYSGHIDNSNFMDLRIAGNNGSNWGGHYTQFSWFYPNNNGSFGWMETSLPINFFGPLTWGYYGAGTNPLYRGITQKTAQKVETIAAPAAALFPNPAKNTVTLNFKAAENSRLILRVTDMQGKQQLQQKATLVKGENRVPVNISGLVPAHYVLTATGETGKTFQYRFIKE